MTTESFSLHQPTTIHFGNDSIASLGEIVLSHGCKKVFLVVDPGVNAAGLLPKITEVLEKSDLAYELFEDIDPEPGLRLADNGASRAKENNCDCVVGVGGGSAMDVAKAISILITNEGNAEDYLGLGKISKPGVPKIMVPTTAGTGAEVTFTAVFINEKTGSKGGMNGDPLYPDAAILDPCLTLTMPQKVTAATGIDALTHALEAFVSTQSHTLSDMYALEAIALISENLRPAYANGDNMEARAKMLLGSLLLGGKALAAAGVGLVHAMAYPLGGMYHTAHGLANAVLLPYVMEYNLTGNLRKYAFIAETMGYCTEGYHMREAAQGAVDAVVSLNMDVGIPVSLEEIGIERERIPEMARIALTVTRPVENNPRKPTLDDVIKIYETAFSGWE